MTGQSSVGSQLAVRGPHVEIPVICLSDAKLIKRMTRQFVNLLKSEFLYSSHEFMHMLQSDQTHIYKQNIVGYHATPNWDTWVCHCARHVSFEQSAHEHSHYTVALP